MAEHPSQRSGGPWIELGTSRESFLQVLDENANFGRQPAAGRPNGNDWHCSLKGGQKTMTVPSLSSAAKSHAAAWAIPRCSRTPIRICSISLVRKIPVGITRLAFCPAPKLHGCTEPPRDKNYSSKAAEFVRRFRDTVACDVESGDENGHRLSESSQPEWSLEDHLSR